MAWERHSGALTARIDYSSAVRAWLSLRGDQTLVLNLTISAVMATNFPALDSPTAHVGVLTDPDDVGLIRLEFTPALVAEGDVPVRALGRYVKRITMLAPSGLSQADRAAEACVIVERDEHSMVLRLPLAAWEAARSRAGSERRPVTPRPPEAPPAPAARPASPPPAPARDTNGPGGRPADTHGDHKLDACRYLARKGMPGLTRDDHGQYMLGDMIVAEGDVLKRVNKARSETDPPLKPVTLLDLA